MNNDCRYIKYTDKTHIFYLSFSVQLFSQSVLYNCDQIKLTTSHQLQVYLVPFEVQTSAGGSVFLSGFSAAPRCLK